MDYKLPKGYIDLIEKKYNLKVLDNHYILVDKNFQRNNMMIDVQFNDKMFIKKNMHRKNQKTM